MTFTIIAILVLCFWFAPVNWALTPAELTGADLFLHAFRHQDLTHLAANAITLAAFGWWFERRRGPVETLCLFCAATVVAGSVELLAEPDYPGRILGASGAVAAFLGAFGRLERWAALVVVPTLLWFAWQLVDPSDASAHYAHLGGLTFGFLWGAVGTPGTQARPLDTPVSTG